MEKAAKVEKAARMEKEARVAEKEEREGMTTIAD